MRKASEKQPVAPPQQKCPIMRLPDEILTVIVELVGIHRHTREPWLDYVNVGPISRTCRRIYQLAMPIQYRSLMLDRGRPADKRTFVPPCPAMQALHRSLRDNPVLGEYCREFGFHFNHRRLPDEHEITAPDIAVLTDLAASFPRARFLRAQVDSLQDSQARHFWDIIKLCMQSMHCLYKLELIGNSSNVMGPQEIMSCVLSPPIRTLSVRGVRLDSNLDDSFWKSFKPHPSNITKMILSQFNVGLEATSSFLNWPKGLIELSCDYYLSSPPPELDLQKFGTMLAKHKETLTTLDISSISREGRGKIFDLSEFTALKYLGLSAWQIGSEGDDDFSFRDEHKLLLSPRLEKFDFVLDLPDQWGETWLDFANPQQSWLRNFADAAIIKGIPLAEIEIIYWPSTYHLRRDDGYPWDLMDSLRHELQLKGIVLTRPEPSISRERYLEWSRKYGRDRPKKDDSQIPNEE